MSSVRERIIQATVKALEGHDLPAGFNKPAGLNVHRYRTRPIEKDKLPAIVVYPGPPVGDARGESVGLATHDGDVERKLVLRLECRATGDPPDAAVDPLTTWAVQALLAGFHRSTLGELAVGIEERATDWDAVASNLTFAAAAADFEITYFTREDDPEVQS